MGRRPEDDRVLRRILDDIEVFLADPKRVDVLVESETDLRRLVPVTGRPRRLLVREMERAEAFRSRAIGRAFDPAPTLGTLLRLAKIQFRAELAPTLPEKCKRWPGGGG